MGESSLQNQNIYSIYECSDGKLYCATNHGLFLYTNGVFKKVETTHEQKGSALFGITEDNEGTVYCYNLSGQVFRLERHKLVLAYELERKWLGKKVSIAFDYKNNLVVSSKAIVHVKKEGVEILEKSRASKYIYQSKNRKIFIDTPLQNKLYFYHPSSVELDSLQLQPALAEPVGYWEVIQPDTSTFIVYSYEGEILNISADGSYSSLPTNIKRGKLYPTSDTSFLITHLTKGAQHFIIRNDTIFKDFNMWPNTFISTATYSKNGAVLLGTFGNGIQVIPSIENRAFDIETEGEIRGLCGHHNQLFFSTSGAEIGLIENGQVKILKNDPSASLDKVFYLQYSKPNLLNQNPHLFFNQFDHKTPYKTIKNIYEVDSNQYLIAASNGVFLRTHKEPKGVIWDKTFDEKIYQLKSFQVRSRAVTLQEDQLIIGSVRGLFVITFDGKAYELKYKGRSINASTIQKYNGKILIGSHAFGVLTLDDNNTLSPFLPIQKNSLSKYIRKIIVQNEIIYILTEKGVEIHNLNKQKCSLLGLQEGVTGGQLLNFAVTQNKTWVLSNGSLTQIDQRQIAPFNKKIDLQMYQVLVNDSPVDFSSDHAFSYNENDFEFQPRLYDFSVFDEVQIEFKLNGFEESWHIMNKKDFTIQYKSLPPGEYELLIKTTYKNKSDLVFQYFFTVDAPYWQKTWFFILVIGFFVGITIVVFLVRIKVIERKNKRLLEAQEKEKIVLQNKLKALRSQMNPHFIFNSINSIQDLILKEDTDASYDYVVLLSELVRSTLSFSDKEFITLEEEIQYLEAYLGLEKLRFKDDFEYTIENKVSQNPKIPSLMIQPFVENSLQHGLFHKSGSKKLSLIFEQETKYIKCTITDNGIGRNAASRYQSKNKGHQSFSLSAIQQRMEVFQQQYQADFHYTYHDLVDDKGLVCGTSVVVLLPYQ